MGSGAGGVKSTVVVDKHPKMLVWAAIGLVVVAAGCHLFVSLALYPTAVYWMTYYVPNYAFGFVRRGLGGEIIHLLPDADYFPPAAYTMMWAPVVVWLAALGGFGMADPVQRREDTATGDAGPPGARVAVRTLLRPVHAET